MEVREVLEMLKDLEIQEQNLMVGLEVLKDLQRPALELLNQYNLERSTLTCYATALMIEAAEFCNEVPWKQWKNREINPEAVAEEFADLLHFIGTWLNLMELMGIPPETIAEAFMSKNLKNRERMAGRIPGYKADPVSVPPEFKAVADRLNEPRPFFFGHDPQGY